MALEHDVLGLTALGAKWVNAVIPLFAAPSVQSYLLARDPATADDMTRNRKLAERTAGAA